MKRLWLRWKALARRIGNVQARLFLTVFYFVVAVPFGLGIRWFSDPLSIKRPRNAPTWTAREIHTGDLDEARRQY